MQQTYLNPEYTFERYIVHHGNRLACSVTGAIMNVTGSFNPLLISGSSGVGKSHLLHAIGHQLKNINALWNVICSTSECLGEHFNQITEQGRSLTFQKNLLAADVLLIDDIDVLADKYPLQNALLCVIDELVARRKQVVLTSLYPTKELGAFGERLRACYAYMLEIDITASYANEIIQKESTMERFPTLEQSISLFHQAFDKTDASVTNHHMENNDNKSRNFDAGNREDGDLWESILNHVKSKISTPSFDTWFKPAKANIGEDFIQVEAPNEFCAEWLDAHYKDLILKTVKSLTGHRYDVRIVRAR
jgi:chromosomal replication initiator protein